MSAPDRPSPSSPDCFRCRHHWITHDPPFPYGCRAFGVRSHRMPSALVLESTGQPCTAFEPKPARPDRSPSRDAPG